MQHSENLFKEYLISIESILCFYNQPTHLPMICMLIYSKYFNFNGPEPCDLQSITTHYKYDRASQLDLWVFIVSCDIPVASGSSWLVPHVTLLPSLDWILLFPNTSLHTDVCLRTLIKVVIFLWKECFIILR